MANNQSRHPASVPGPLPIWRLGFRPFFLFGSVFASVSILIWLALFLGSARPLGPFDPILWHAHEMIYGYVTAVIAGFVLTAAQNWTGKPGLRGLPLALLFALWAAGRVAISTASSPHPWVAVADLSFYPALAIAMFPYLKPADMKVERVFFLYFALFIAGNLMMHLEALNLIRGYGLKGALLGLNTAILMIVFMGGRVLPFFTESEKAAAQPKIRAPVEILSHLLAWAFLVTQFFAPHTALTGIVAIATGVIHFIRLSGWYVRRVRRVAILWVLYSSYLWIVIGFMLMGLVSLGVLPPGPPIHALTIGGLGIMTYGMMSRVSLGHTGRRLSPSRIVIAGYVLLNLACILRVFGPIFDVSRFGQWILASGLLWVAAFIAMLLVYAPMLVRPRLDHRPG